MTYKERRDAGLCAWCNNPAYPGQVCCVGCKEKQRLKALAKKEQGICKECTEPVEHGYTRCTKHKEEQVARFVARKEAGICFRCSDPALPGHTTCEVCMTRRAEERHRRKLQGLCHTCTSPAEPGKTHCLDCQDRTKKRHRALKIEVMEAYGGVCCACPGCNVTNIQVLTIDHINNDGAEHRKIINSGELYSWLKKNNFPPGFRVLCYNCNCGRRHGLCPLHEINT
jgi:hypothetical protein